MPGTTQTSVTELPDSPTATEIEPSAIAQSLPATLAATASNPPPEATMTETAEPAPASPSAVSEQEPAATANVALKDLSIEPQDIFIFPVPAVYTGDRVSFQVSPRLPRGLAPNDVDVRILVDGEELVSGNLNWRNLNGDTFGLYQWAWDTTDQAGTHTVTAVLDPNDLIQLGDENPGNNQASISVVVEPRENLPKAEANASWVSVSNACCTVHVVSDTAAQRDIDKLLPIIDAAFTQAAAMMDEPLNDPYDVFLVDRVIGQGGYAIDSMVVSYLDRNYAGGGLNEVMVHEAVHLIDQQFAPDRITFLSEGLAVWVAGGHYQQEDLGQRMAALVELGLDIPLPNVIENFQAIQHEIGYLEAASFVSYLIETYGWPRVRDFYAATTADDGYALAGAISANLQGHFGKSLEEVEADWREYLLGFPRDRSVLTNLEATIRFYDVMRRYQTLYDPTAYYLYAWLPEPENAQEWEATADLNRHPEAAVNIALETMLQAANEQLSRGDFALANALLDSVNRVMNNNGQFLDPLAKAHLDIVLAAEEMGYEVQKISVTGSQAVALVTRPNRQEMTQLQLVLSNNRKWTLTK